MPRLSLITIRLALITMRLALITMRLALITTRLALMTMGQRDHLRKVPLRAMVPGAAAITSDGLAIRRDAFISARINADAMDTPTTCSSIDEWTHEITNRFSK